VTTEELEELVAAGEGTTVEFKETTGQRGDACHTLCAFLNGQGGTVVFGVSRKGKLVGQFVSDETKKDLARCFYDLEPGVIVDVEYVPVNETHQAIVCHVERGARRPYAYDGRPYKRVESTTVRMPQDEYDALLKSRAGYASEWERKVNPELTLDDIDLEEVRRTARKAVNVGRLDEATDTEDAVSLLDHFKVRKDGRFLNAAAALFGKIHVGNYPQCQLKLGWFKGHTTKTFGDIDNKFGHIGQLMDVAMRFCFKHLNLSAVISGKIERDEELEIPAAALREALINAFAHRSYEERGTTVYLAIFEDRVEIRNPGDFPAELNTKRLFSPPQELSIPRNPLIANVLYMRKSIETWGRGLGVMAEECQRFGLPLPVTDVKGGFVVTTFMRPEATVGMKSGTNLDQRDPDPIQIDPDVDPDNGDKLNARLLEVVRFNPLISRKMLAAELDVSERKVRETIKKLKDVGIILRQGPDHGGIWRISRIIKNSVNGGTQGVGNVGNRVGNDVVNVVNGVVNHVAGVANDAVKCRSDQSASVDAIIGLLRQDNRMSAAKIALALGMVERTVQRMLKKLKTEGRIRRVGGTRGHWEVDQWGVQ